MMVRRPKSFYKVPTPPCTSRKEVVAIPSDFSHLALMIRPNTMAEFLSVFEGVPQAEVSAQLIQDGISVIDFISEATGFLSSKGDARRALKENSIGINKCKVNDSYVITQDDLIGGKHVLVQRGKKNYFLARIS